MTSRPSSPPRPTRRSIRAGDKADACSASSFRMERSGNPEPVSDVAGERLPAPAPCSAKPAEPCHDQRSPPAQPLRRRPAPAPCRAPPGRGAGPSEHRLVEPAQAQADADGGQRAEPGAGQAARIDLQEARARHRDPHRPRHGRHRRFQQGIGCQGRRSRHARPCQHRLRSGRGALLHLDLWHAARLRQGPRSSRRDGHLRPHHGRDPAGRSRLYPARRPHHRGRRQSASPVGCIPRGRRRRSGRCDCRRGDLRGFYISTSRCMARCARDAKALVAPSVFGRDPASTRWLASTPATRPVDLLSTRQVRGSPDARYLGQRPLPSSRPHRHRGRRSIRPCDRRRGVRALYTTARSLHPERAPRSCGGRTGRVAKA